MLTFLNPAAFWGLLLAIPLIAVYLMRNRPAVRKVATLIFWDDVEEQTGATRLLGRLRAPISLLVQLVLLLLLISAVSHPVLNSADSKAGLQIFVLDNSASMQAATSGNVSRLETAKKQLASLIGNAPVDSEFAVLVACPEPTVICPPTKSRAVALSQLDSVQSTDCVAHLDSTVRFAEAMISDPDAASLTLFTDAPGSFQQNDDIPLEIRTVGRPQNNVAISKFRARRSETDPLLWQLLVEVANLSDQEASVVLQIRLDGNLIDVVPLDLAAGQVERKVLSRTSAEGGLITGSLHRDGTSAPWEDALSVDNEAFTLLAQRPPISVVLYSQEGWFLKQVLRANPLVQLTVMTDWDAAGISAAGNADVVVFDSFVPDNWPPQNLKQPLRALCVAPSISSRLWEVNGQVEQTFVGDYQNDHPLVEYLQLEEVVINNAVRVTTVGPAEVVASAIDGEPLLISFQEPDLRVLVFAVDLNRSDLPLRTSFPILLTNALGWLTERQPELLAQANTRSAISVPIESAVSGGNDNAKPSLWTFVSPDGAESSVVEIDGEVAPGILSKVGVYRLVPGYSEGNDASETQGRSETREQLLPCNLASLSESRLNVDVDQSGTSVENAASGGWPDFSIQRVLLLLALVGILLEGWLWHRRLIE